MSINTYTVVDNELRALILYENWRIYSIHVVVDSSYDIKLTYKHTIFI